MLVLEKGGFYFKVEAEDEERELYEVSGLSLVGGSDGPLFNPKKTDKKEISFEEAETYDKNEVDDSRYR